MNTENNSTTAAEKTYPLPTSDGFFFDDEDNELLGIESKTYENGNQVRRIILSGSRTAIVRELTAREMGTDVQRLAAKNTDTQQYAMVAIATTINDKGITLEDVYELKAKDYVKLQAANSQLNF